MGAAQSPSVLTIRVEGKLSMKNTNLILAAAIAGMFSGGAHAFQFSTDTIDGSLDSTVAAGVGIRMKSASCSLVGDGVASGCGASANTAQTSNADNGDLNYKKHQLFTEYLKGSHELLLSMPSEGLKFMARASWMEDFAATATNRSQLASDAAQQIGNNQKLLDFWISKSFSLGDQSGRVRLGNQVISWGESIYAPGGINSINALDLQKLSVPGTLLKDAVIPAPMISVATGLAKGVNIEAFYQFRWNSNIFPPVGTYFSTSDNLGKGRESLYLNTSNFNFGGIDATEVAGSRSQTAIAAANAAMVSGANPNTFGVPIGPDKTPKNSGQFGAALHYHPENVTADFGLYFLNYHDKSPQLDALANGTIQQVYLENRQLYGISANAPVGNWAVGWELSYRPKDAVALTGCYNPGGPLDANTNGVSGVECKQWMDNKRYQMHLTGLLSMTPSDNPTILSALKADTAALTLEAVGIYYPGVNSNKRIYRTVNGVQTMQAVDAVAGFWQNNNSGLGYPIQAAVGTAFSWGFTADFNWTYDGKLIPGWQVTPGVTYTRAVKGYTPNLVGNYLQGAQSANFYLLFNQNPTKWQAGLNYTAYFGGNAVSQPLSDRNFLGAFVSYSF